MTHQPDFATTPRLRRVPPWGNLAIAAGVAALALAGGAAWRARAEAREARARLGEVRRQIETASLRLRALQAGSGANRAVALAVAAAPPARVVAGVASALPADARLSHLSIDYSRGPAVELGVVARDASAWDRLLAGLEKAPEFREVEPGPEAREAQVRSVVRARWAGGRP